MKSIDFKASVTEPYPFMDWINRCFQKEVDVRFPVDEPLCRSVEGCHFHPYPELFLQMEGESRFSLPRSNLLLKPGQAMVMPKGVPHSEWLVEESAPFKNMVILVTPVAWRVHFGVGGHGKHPCVSDSRDFVLPQARLGVNQMNLVLDALDSGASSRLLSCLLGGVLSFLSEGKEVHRRRSPRLHGQPTLVGECLDLAESSFSRSDCNVESLARELKCHPTHLSRLFSRSVGKPLSQFLISKRMDLAKSNLTMGGLNVAQTAYSCGYEDVSHFVATFRRHFGVTPKQYSLQMTSAERTGSK